MEELYGGINKLTLEWHDGLMGITVRHTVQVGVSHGGGGGDDDSDDDNDVMMIMMC